LPLQRSLAPLGPLLVSILRKLAVATHRNVCDMRWFTGMVAAAAACATPSSAGTAFECTIHRDLCGFDVASTDAPTAPPLAEDCCVSTVPSPPNMNNCGGSVAPLLCVHCAITTQHDQTSSNLSPVVHAVHGSTSGLHPKRTFAMSTHSHHGIKADCSVVFPDRHESSVLTPATKRRTGPDQWGCRLLGEVPSLRRVAWQQRHSRCPHRQLWTFSSWVGLRWMLPSLPMPW
jgi:hypothetical protein